MSETAAAITHGHALGAQAWDRLLLEQPEGNLLQSWTWGELQARFGWQPRRSIDDVARDLFDWIERHADALRAALSGANI